MRAKIIITVAVVSVLLAATMSAQAQVFSSMSASTSTIGPHHGLEIHYPGHHGRWRYGYHGGTTAAGSYLRGWGYAVRSLGEYNVLNSIAARHNQEAYSRYLDNEVKETDTYFQKRQLNAEYRAVERGPVQTAEQINARAQASAPKRLTAGQLEPALGTINWPASLKGDEFAEQRAEVEQLFRDRAATGAGMESQIYSDVQQVCDQMRAQLDEQVKEMRPMEFIASKNFIAGLNNEARFNTTPNQGLVLAAD